jgi:Protein of unknown function (DUF992)
LFCRALCACGNCMGRAGECPAGQGWSADVRRIRRHGLHYRLSEAAIVLVRAWGAGRHEDYDGSITKFGLDLGLTRGGFMVWSVFTNTVAGPGFLAGDYVGASGQATIGAGLEANVLVGALTARPHCSPYRSADRRALISQLVSQLFISAFRGNDWVLNSIARQRSARSRAVFSRTACWAALYSASASAP